MSKGYKKEYINKVKEKFNNDLQPISKGNSNAVAIKQDDSLSKVCKSNRMVKLG